MEPFPFPVFIFFLLFITVIPPSNALSFNFTTFSAAENAYLVYERCYSNPNTGDIQLTTDSDASIGRATFARPLHLWDNSTRNLTDFSTYFSFAIDSRNRSNYGDGLAFFLAPVGSKIPDDTTRGSTLGLVHDWQVINTTMDLPSNSSLDSFLAVEFDIYQNFFDPPGTHAGLDLDSMRSVVNTSWMGDIKAGKETRVWIDYKSATHRLSIVFTGYGNDSAETVVMQNLSYVVDLRLRLPEWVTFGFSAATGNATAAHTVSAWNFSSNLEGESIIIGPASRTKRIGKGMTVGITIALGIGFVGILAMILLWWRHQRRTSEKNEEIMLRYMGDGCPGSTGPKKFSYAELVKATENFKPESKLGEGGFGGVYKGYIKSVNIHVAVKRVSRGSKQGVKEYASEVKVISRLRHRNLVQLIGWCHDKQDELLLVYEFMANGSLDFHLYDSDSVFPWEMRYQVARGLASVLLYLHEEWEQCVLHRDIKSSNVMLDSEFNAKLGDFGLARMIDHAKRSPTTALAGTFGYMAPECARTFRATKETDVYSFGVVCLEIVSGRRPIEYREPEDPFVLVDWVYELHSGGEVIRSVDPRLCGHFDEEQVERLVTVGLWCTHPEKHRRPSAGQANQVLHFDVPVPPLPPRLHLPSFSIRNGNITESDSSSTCINTSQIYHSSSMITSTNSVTAI
ncbi:hypothetical protein MLD38_013442 [Melastoma candidum]|uniref:Uncharacterized protein n=1 Tax=Melastoma candidum TaxID=119954 RepID=A0ACB9RDS2_9MYRT|nr:hypothetical protein MLD38_013442 [Melastoma candidum]